MSNLKLAKAPFVESSRVRNGNTTSKDAVVDYVQICIIFSACIKLGIGVIRGDLAIS